jgi:hypothetical protein
MRVSNGASGTSMAFSCSIAGRSCGPVVAPKPQDLCFSISGSSAAFAAASSEHLKTWIWVTQSSA